jgi:hypothetical protein
MRRIWKFAVLLLFLMCAVCSAQSKEVGVAAGFGFYHDATIATPAGEAQAGFGPRFAVSVMVAHRFQTHFAGEFRYIFQDGDSELRSGALEANLDAHAQSLLGDLLIFARSRRPKLQPYGAAGFGVKIYQATEVPRAGRPLMNFAMLTNDTQARPLLTLGGGIEYIINSRWAARVDLRDYATPFPNKLFPLAPGAQLSGWLHDFVPLIGVSRRF